VYQYTHTYTHTYIHTYTMYSIFSIPSILPLSLALSALHMQVYVCMYVSKSNNTMSFLPVKYVFSLLRAPARADITSHQRVSFNAELDRHQSQAPKQKQQPPFTVQRAYSVFMP